MKRWTFRFVLCLLLGVAPGAVTTVAVAWGCNRLVADADAQWNFVANPSLHWIHQRKSARPHVKSVIRREVLFGREEAYTGVVGRSNVQFALRRQIGWPTTALEGGIVHVLANDSTKVTGFKHMRTEAINAIPSDEPGANPRHFLPLRPILPGFLINTLFYGVIWLCLILGWRAHRRVVRRWQGYCPLCTYDLRGDLSTGCPECGWGRAL